jgi:hypothetical protein
MGGVLKTRSKGSMSSISSKGWDFRLPIGAGFQTGVYKRFVEISINLKPLNQQRVLNY